MNTCFKRLREVVLTCGALGGVICLAMGAASLFLGLTPLVVQSGSMEPTISTGSLLVTKDTPAADLKIDDVVTVKRKDGALITHRIVEVEPSGDAVALRLKGDDNNAIDSDVYVVERAGRMVVAIPFLGWVAAGLASPVGLFGLGLYAAVLVVIVGQGLRRPPEIPRGGSRKAGKRKAADMVATGAGALLVLTAVLVPAAPKGTLAAWTDTAGVAGTTLSTYTVPAPVASCGLLTVGATNVYWSAVPGATSYTLQYGAGGSSTTTVPGSTTSYGLTGLITGGTFNVKANINYGSTTWTSVASNSLSYTNLLFLVSLCS